MDIGIASLGRTFGGGQRLFQPRKPVLLNFSTDTLIVGRPARFYIETRRAVSVTLSVSDRSGDIYNGVAPPRGFVTITPLNDSMHARLVLIPDQGQDANFEWALEAKSVPPGISQANAPAQARAALPFPVSWKAKGEVTVDVEGCGLKGRHSGQSVGAFVLHPEYAGIIVLRFTATDRYGTTVKTRVVRVDEVPPPLISLNQRVAADKPGRKAVFSWTITGAEKAWIELRGGNFAVKLQDGFSIGIDTHPENIRLVAKGRGGITAEKLSVIPRFTSGLD